MVLIKEDFLPINTWPLGRVVEVYHGSDRKARVVKVKTQSVVFSQRSSSPRLIEDETFNDSDIINNLIDYEDGQEEPDSLRADKNIQGSSFPTNWKSIFLK
ncbi:uncharacterized protein TNCV_13171 [Trichonephila clavipes]|nr:uncharacterized protein TNCV_13171 [Trichonephila clavipes]